MGFSYCSLSSDGCCTRAATYFKFKLLKALLIKNFLTFKNLICYIFKDAASMKYWFPFNIIESDVKLANEFICTYRYGLKEFLVIHPAEDTEAVDSESKCHLLLSSIGIAATNSKWYTSSMYCFNQRDNFYSFSGTALFNMEIVEVSWCIVELYIKRAEFLRTQEKSMLLILLKCSYKFIYSYTNQKSMWGKLTNFPLQTV